MKNPAVAFWQSMLEQAKRMDDESLRKLMVASITAILTSLGAAPGAPDSPDGPVVRPTITASPSPSTPEAPEPTVTVIPSPTLSPTATSSPTVSPTVKPTTSPAKPTATATTQPAPEKPEPTPEKPTATAEPTTEPTKTSTPEPTPEPEKPEPSPEPTPEPKKPEPTPEPKKPDEPKPEPTPEPKKPEKPKPEPTPEPEQPKPKPTQDKPNNDAGSVQSIRGRQLLKVSGTNVEIEARKKGMTEWVKPITREAQALWAAHPSHMRDIRRGAQESKKSGQLFTAVMYYIPNRDCNGAGAGTLDSYRDFTGKFVKALEGSKALVVIEPDAVAQPCYKTDKRMATAIAEAVNRLKDAGHWVMIDAGHHQWNQVDEISSRLKHAGIARADGFTLNVAGRHTLEGSKNYGNKLSAKTGKPFIVDTSRNGNGPAKDKWGKDDWCNTPSQGLGQKPTLYRTGSMLATMWIKNPGESDGYCNGSKTAAGHFDAGQAYNLIKQSPYVSQADKNRLPSWN